MNTISAFDVIGPAMVGPSSSHTAGAVRIGRMARALLAAPPCRAEIDLHGSFAATGRGHATDRALVAGLLDFPPDDARLKDSLDFAKEAGLSFHFQNCDLGEDFHPNTARIKLRSAGGEERQIIGSSTGGGRVAIVEVDRYSTLFDGNLETVVLWHRDTPGFLSKVTTLLACVEANIATIRTSRNSRGADALTVIELDTVLPEDCLSLLGKIPSTACLRRVPRQP